MIFVDRTVTINRGTSTIDEPIVLYRGDYDVAIRFTIIMSNVKFKSGYNMIEYENSSNAQLAILKPNGDTIFSEIVRCNNGVAEFIFYENLIDEISEVGNYSFHIRLFDYTQRSRFTIPEVVNGIIVREPIVSEDRDNRVEVAMADYAVATYNAEEGEPPTEESELYEKTEWVSGDKITVNRLNKVENALADIYNLLQAYHEECLASKEELNTQQTTNFEVLMSEIEALKNN